jgi:predicted GIY-YIG superfamily endonuclease
MVFIYALVSGQLILYVGRTNDMKRRIKDHRCKKNNSHSKYIPEYIDWTMKLLETVPDDQGTVKEQYYYDTLKPFYNRYRPGQTPEEHAMSNLGREVIKRYEQSEARREARRRYYIKKKSES